MPDAQKLLNTLRRARDHFAATPGRRGHWIDLPDADEVMVAGDLHGNLQNFAALLKKADLANHPRRHLIVQELIHGSFRYPDGSDRSHQLVDLVAALKCQYPLQVHFVLGNHELSQWTGETVGKGEGSCNDLFMAGVEHAYGTHSTAIYQAYIDIFQSACFAIRTANRIFISHSSPSAHRLETFDPAALQKPTLEPDDLRSGTAIYSLVWGRDPREDTVARFLDKVDADLLITGHLPCEDGFSIPNARQLILDSESATACYCLFPGRGTLTLDDLRSGVRRLYEVP